MQLEEALEMDTKLNTDPLASIRMKVMISAPAINNPKSSSYKAVIQTGFQS